MADALDPEIMQLAESIGLIGPSSRTHDLHDAIQRFHDLICVNATLKAAKMAADVLTAAAEPVYWEFRCLDTHPDTVTSGHWSAWEKVEPRNRLQTVESRLAELRGFIAQGQRIEIRALYAQPSPPVAAPAEPDWWRPHASKIEDRVAASGSPAAMACFTDMRTLMQEVARPQPPRPGTAPLSDEQIGEICELYVKLIREKRAVHIRRGYDAGADYYIGDVAGYVAHAVNEAAKSRIAELEAANEMLSRSLDESLFCNVQGIAESLAAQPQPPAAPLTPTDGELLSLIREKFALEELPMVWQGVKVGDHVNHWRCSDCDEEAASSPEIVHNKGCSYFTHMERIARENKIRARLQELAGITTHKDAP